MALCTVSVCVPQEGQSQSGVGQGSDIFLGGFNLRIVQLLRNSRRDLGLAPGPRTPTPSSPLSQEAPGFTAAAAKEKIALLINQEHW